METLELKTVSKSRKYDYVCSIFRHEHFTPVTEQKIDYLMNLPEDYFDMAFMPVYNKHNDFVGYKVNKDVFDGIMSNFEAKENHSEVDLNEDFDYEKMYD